MFGKKVKLNPLNIFSIRFWKFYLKASKKTFIKFPYIRGLKNLYKYFYTFHCIDDINKSLNIIHKVKIEDFPNFRSLYLTCKDWENGKVNGFIIAYLNKG